MLLVLSVLLSLSSADMPLFLLASGGLSLLLLVSASGYAFASTGAYGLDRTQKRIGLIGLASLATTSMGISIPSASLIALWVTSAASSLARCAALKRFPQGLAMKVVLSNTLFKK